MQETKLREVKNKAHDGIASGLQARRSQLSPAVAAAAAPAAA
jgi:hypothetical protein